MRSIEGHIVKGLKPPEHPAIPLDTWVKVGTRKWKIGLVKWDGWERYYGLTDKNGDVALFPADIVETEENRSPKKRKKEPSE
jgi:hypothetical protein